MVFECVEKLTCPACSRKNPIKLLSCMYCGEKLEKQVQQESEKPKSVPDEVVARANEVSCPKCARRLKSGSGVCMYCGCKVFQWHQKTERICPRCEVPMNTKKSGFAAIEECSACHGEFFDAEEIYAAGTVRSDEWRWLARHLRPCPHDTGDAEALLCPACKSAMETVQVVGIGHCVFNKCSTCRGLWLDDGETEKLQEILRGRASVKRKKAQKVNVTVTCRKCFHKVKLSAANCLFCGEPLKADENKEELARFCPRCDDELEGQNVTHREDGKTTIFVIDSCPRCRGVFYDDGEFRRAGNLNDDSWKAFVQRMALTRHDSENGLPLQCPGCDGPMTTYRIANRVEFCLIDHCPACKGVWLDDGEAEDLQAIVSSKRR